MPTVEEGAARDVTMMFALLVVALAVGEHTPRAVGSSDPVGDIAGLRARDRRQLRTAINIISVSVVGVSRCQVARPS